MNSLAERGPTQVEEVITEIESPTVLATLSRAEIDTQIATANRYPRSIRVFKLKAMELVTLDEETAGSMFYALPRDGKTIEGPSARMAEVIGSCWKNLRYQARVIDIGEDFVTAQGMCFDLENNVAASMEVMRRIKNKYGKRYNDDMIGVTANAACSIALRNAIFKIVPRALWTDIYEAARETSIGKAETMQARRDKVAAYFAKMGVDEKKLCGAVNRAGLEDLTIDDIITLRGFATAIKSGETSIEAIFNPQPEQATPRSNAEKVAAAVESTKAKIAKPQADAKPADAPESEADRKAREDWERIQRGEPPEKV